MVRIDAQKTAPEKPACFAWAALIELIVKPLSTKKKSTPTILNRNEQGSMLGLSRFFVSKPVM